MRVPRNLKPEPTFVPSELEIARDMLEWATIQQMQGDVDAPAEVERLRKYIESLLRGDWDER